MTHTSHADGVAGACPDLDTLADLHAGVLDSTTATTLRAHVETCSRCTATMEALDATVLDLESMPPIELPAAFANRLDAALAAEAGRGQLRSVSSPGAAAPQPPSSDRRLGQTPTGSGSPHADQRAGQPTNISSLSDHRERRKLGKGRMLLVAAAAVVVVGGGTFALTQGGENNANVAGQDSSAPAVPPNVTAPQDSAEVQAFSTPADVLENGAIENNRVSPEIAGKMAEQSARAQCLNLIVPRPAAAPEAVQEGTYEGSLAYAFVFPTSDSETIEMIVVDADDCGTTLHTTTGPRE